MSLFCIWIFTACSRSVNGSLSQGEGRTLAEKRCPGVWAETTGWGDGERHQPLRRLSHSVQLVAPQVQLQVSRAAELSFRKRYCHYNRENNVPIWVCLSPDCVAVRFATTAAVTQSALSPGAAESAAVSTVTISTARWLSATRRRKWATTPLGRLLVVYCKLGELWPLQVRADTHMYKKCPLLYAHGQHSALECRFKMHGCFSGAEVVEKLDDGIFDIITEEEVSGVYDSDSLSFSTACSPGHGQQGAAQL